MPPGNAACLHTWLCEFAEYSGVPVPLGGDEVMIHHSQFAQYPFERAARVVYDTLTVDPATYADYTEFREALLEVAYEEIKGAVTGLTGVTVDVSEQHQFAAETYIEPTKLAAAVTRLTTMYDGFEPPAGADTHYERYGESRTPPTTKAELVADLFTMFHAERASAHVHTLRSPNATANLTEFEANVALYAMRDCIEKQHGWSVFTPPTPARETIETLWEMLTDVGFDPAVRWVYGLYVVPNGAKRYEPHDTVYRTTRASMGNVIREDITGQPPEMRYTAAETTADDLIAHRKQMRDQWTDTH